jgi:hypothetical protein
MYRFEENWNTLRDIRIAAYNAATNRKNSYERRARAVDKLRTMTMHAGIFAVTSVHNSVQNNERQYVSWTQGNPIRGLDIHVRGPERIGAFVATMDIGIFANTDGDDFIAEAYKVFGLGSAKATFMGALMGFDNAGCIDTHMFRMAKEKGIANTAGVPGSLVSYNKLKNALFPHTLDQWRAFMVVPHYAATQHDVYFHGVLSALGKKAITATV